MKPFTINFPIIHFSVRYVSLKFQGIYDRAERDLLKEFPPSVKELPSSSPLTLRKPRKPRKSATDSLQDSLPTSSPLTSAIEPIKREEDLISPQLGKSFEQLRINEDFL